jgi:hypothetical protein
VTELKPYTHYRCPVGGAADGHSSKWTGAYRSEFRRPNDHLCICGAEYVEVVDDGHTYRVAWEAQGPFTDGWAPSHRDTTDRGVAEAQYRVLKQWEEIGVEPVRNVTMARAVTVWEPYDPDPGPERCGADVEIGYVDGDQLGRLFAMVYGRPTRQDLQVPWGVTAAQVIDVCKRAGADADAAELELMRMLDAMVPEAYKNAGRITAEELRAAIGQITSEVHEP